MKLARRLLPILLIAMPGLADVRSHAIDAYGKLPLRFERNDGQTAGEVAYLSRGRGSTLFLTRGEAVLALRDRNEKRAVLRLRMIGANAAPSISGEEALPGTTNYLIGNDRRQWHTGVPSYRRVRYADVWRGVDLVWHGAQNALEYDFVVAPGADPARIAIEVDGAKRLRIDAAGNLVAETAAGEVIQRAPVVYQDGPRGRTRVAGKYALRRRRVTFDVAAYDNSRPLIIDPVLTYSTFLGGALNEEAFGVAVDGLRNAYVTGPTDSIDFPKALLLTPQSEALVFVAKLNAEGTDLEYSTLIGTNRTGNLTFDEGADTLIATGIAVTSDGRAVITGGIDNSNRKSGYPVTQNAFQDAGFCVGNCGLLVGDRAIDAFVTMLTSDGRALLYSTFYGGAKAAESGSFDRGEAVAVEDSGRIYIAGLSNANDLPTKNGFQNNRKSSGSGFDAFVAVFDPSQPKGRDTLLYASFLGGRDDDHGLGIAIDPDRNAYVGGKTRSDDLKTKSPAGQSLPPLQAKFQGGAFDGFLAKIDTEARGDDSLTYLTYFGGNVNDRVEGVAVDAQQRAYITGASNSSAATFPLRNAFDVTQRNGEAFVAKLNADGTALFYCSFLGGDNANTPNDFEEGIGIAIDLAGNAYVTGNTTSGDSFPPGRVEDPFPPELRGTTFIAKISVTTSGTVVPLLIYSTRFGGDRAKVRGIAVDVDGDAYIAGFTDGGLPVTGGAFQGQIGGGRDAFVAKIGSLATDSTGLYDAKSSEFHLRNTNTTGPEDQIVALGEKGDRPFAGDFDGDGRSDAGVFHGA
ncbi:MAG TPA: SBBP repeat-containing protein, partial [Thermoanaerobaculia bacterium]|nr:SBBP repeat-containing protein [Thermoanaerobaculia bacterium]